MRRTMKRTTAILSFAAVLLAGLAWQQFAGRDTGTVPVQPAAVPAGDHTSPSATAVTPSAAPLPGPGLRLAGIIDTGVSRRALISVAGGEAALFATGARVTEGITLTDIGKDAVTLTDGTRHWELRISRSGDAGSVGELSGGDAAERVPVREAAMPWVTRNSGGEYVAGAAEAALPLKRFGLARDDVILAVNGIAANPRMIAKLNRFLSRPIPGRTLELTVRRGDEVLEIPVREPAAKAVTGR